MSISFPHLIFRTPANRFFLPLLYSYNGLLLFRSVVMTFPSNLTATPSSPGYFSFTTVPLATHAFRSFAILRIACCGSSESVSFG